MQGLWNQVCLYNNPIIPNGSPFEQRNICDFDPSTNRDVLIVFRSPNRRSFGARGLRVWWSCDSHTTGNYVEFSKLVNKIVTISPHHSNFFPSENTFPAIHYMIYLIIVCENIETALTFEYYSLYNHYFSI